MASTKPRPAAALAMARLTSCSTISTTASKFVKRVLRRQNRRCRRCRERQARLCPPPRKKWNQRRIENARWVRHRISPEDAHVETAASAVPRKPALGEVEGAKLDMRPGELCSLSAPTSGRPSPRPAPALHPHSK